MGRTRSAASPAHLHQRATLIGPRAHEHFSKLLLTTPARGLDAQRAANRPHFGSFNGPTVLGAGQFNTDTTVGLKSLGYEVGKMELNSGATAASLVRPTRGWRACWREIDDRGLTAQ